MELEAERVALSPFISTYNSPVLTSNPDPISVILPTNVGCLSLLEFPLVGLVIAADGLEESTVTVAVTLELAADALLVVSVCETLIVALD
jgi:hypothetical protein